MRAGSTQQGDGHSREWRRCSLGIWDRAEGDFAVVLQEGVLVKGRITALQGKAALKSQWGRESA